MTTRGFCVTGRYAHATKRDACYGANTIVPTVRTGDPMAMDISLADSTNATHTRAESIPSTKDSRTVVSDTYTLRGDSKSCR